MSRLAGLRRIGRGLWRSLLWALLLVVVLTLPLLALLGSEAGSRWVVERALGMQRVLRVEVRGGTLLTGLELANAELRTRKVELHIRHLLARWSLVGLLRGEVQLASLEADGVVLALIGPPSAEPVRLPRLVLPFVLDVHALTLREATLRKGERAWRVDQLALVGRWAGTDLRVDSLRAEDAALGRLSLTGQLRFWGDWPLAVQGEVAPAVLTAKGFGPIALRLEHTVEEMDISARSSGALTARLQGRVQPLLPQLPYRADLSWSDLALPWWPALDVQSREGRVRVIGDLKGLRSLGDVFLASRPTPAGRYQWRLRTDWKSADIESFEFNGLGGNIKASSKVSWGSATAWTVTAEAQSLDLSRHWPLPPAVVPPLTGTLESRGRLAATGSELGMTVALANGERWALKDESSGLPWQPATSHRLALEWRGVGRQLPVWGTVASPEGRLAVTGRLQDYRADGEFALAGERLPAGRWQLAVDGGGRELAVERLHYAGDAGALTAAGALDFSAGLDWQADVSLASFQTAWWQPDWPARLDGVVRGSGRVAPGVQQVTLDTLALQGELREWPVAVEGPLQFTRREGRRLPEFVAPDLGLRLGDNHFRVQGRLDEQWAMALALDVQKPEQWWPGSAGQLAGTLALDGPAETPDVAVDLSGQGLAYAGVRAAGMQLKGRLAALGEAGSQLKLDLRELVARGVLAGDVQLAATGTRLAHQIDWQVREAVVTSQGRVQGGWVPEAASWSGALQQAEVAYADLDWQLEAPAVLDWQPSLAQLHMAPHCWQSAPAQFCADAPLKLGAVGQAGFRLEGLRMERLADFLPEGLRWQGPVEGHLAARWQPGQIPEADATLTLGAGLLALDKDDGSTLALPYEQLRLVAQADAREAGLQLSLRSPELGRGEVVLRLDPHGEGYPLAGQVDVEGLRLEVAQPFFPELSQLAGRVGISGRLNGRLRAPTFHGDVRLTEGRLAMRRLPVQAEEVELRVAVAGDEARIDGELQSGPGTATLSGQASWRGEPTLDLALRGQRFELRQEPQLRAEISPDLRLHVVPRQIALRGNVRIPFARINLKSLPERAVNLSPDVRLLEDVGGGAAQQVVRGQPWQVSTDIELLLGDDVSFEGFGLTSKLAGGLRLRQSGQRGLEAAGEVELDKEARYQAYGQNLRIRRGQLVFAGSITQPGLDVEAIREVDDVVVGIRVLGRANAPEATLFSEPAMAQEEALSYLVLGRPLVTAGGGGDNNLMLAAAAIKLGARGGAGLTSGIGNALGINDLSLDAEGSGDDTQVKVSGYLSPSLFLSYGVGVFTPVNTITLRYQIRPRLYLEALSSLENAVDLYYNLRF